MTAAEITKRVGGRQVGAGWPAKCPAISCQLLSSASMFASNALYWVAPQIRADDVMRLAASSTPTPPGQRT
jgi:hypothetical protein